MRIVVVGAGPAGATAALLLARSRRHEVVLLDRDNFPRLKTCGSALSPRCIGLSDALGLTPALRPLAYGIRGLRFTGPSGRSAMLSGKEGAWVIPRAQFDAEIAFAAEREGARFVQGCKVTNVLTDGDRRVHGVSDGTQVFEADLVLFADGAHSRFSSDPRPKRQIATIMGWWEGVPHREGHMEMWFDRRVAPWYGWLFPETPGRVNIGICYRPEDPADPKVILEEIIDRHVGDRMKGATPVRKLRGAPIVYTDRVGEVAAPGALWLGEAARLTNAATGEGIFYAMRSAQIAAGLIDRYANGELGPAYRAAIARAFTLRFQAALGFMRFARTPVFSALTSLITLGPVEKTLTYVLERV